MVADLQVAQQELVSCIKNAEAVIKELNGIAKSIQIATSVLVLVGSIKTGNAKGIVNAVKELRALS